MKKIYIITILSILSLNIICLLYLFNNKTKNNNLNDNLNDNINDSVETITYGLEDVSTYKEENKDRYINYRNIDFNNELSNEEIVRRVNLNLDYNFYEYIIPSINLNSNLVLVNKYYKLDSNYVPENLVNSKYAINSGILACKEAVDNFDIMCADASNIGLNIRVVSAYRSYEHQEGLYNYYLKNDTASNVDTYSARAGHSEHQTGLAFDVYNIKKSYTDFGDTDEYIWVKNNAHLYGFIVRYEKEKEYITGYTYEPWHLRYVGIEAATYIYNNNITLEEYLLNI